MAPSIELPCLAIFFLQNLAVTVVVAFVDIIFVVVAFIDVVISDHKLGRLFLRPRRKELHRRWGVCRTVSGWRYSTVRYLFHNISFIFHRETYCLLPPKLQRRGLVF